MKKHINKLYDYLKKNYKTIILDLVLIFAFITFCYYPLPFVIYRPGGLINLNERISIEGKDPSSGTYNMSYVTVARGNIPNLIMAFLINDWDIKKEEDSLVYDEDYETNLKISQLDLQNSVDVAKLVAFERAGYDVKIKNKQIVVKSIDESADTNLKSLDKIETLNGIDCADIPDLRAFVATFNIGDEVTLKVQTDDGYQEKYAKVYEYENRKVLGITFFERYEYETPLEVDFSSKTTESGSSGGLMLSLTIYDELVEKDLTKGKTIVGTGTIDKLGKVGAIGGIKYKMLGVKNEADIFFAPDANCKEAQNIYKNHDLDFNLVCVKTFEEAISYLNSIN